MTKPAERPKGWASVRLGDHTRVKARLGWKGLKAEEYVEDGYIFLATPNLKANRIDFENVNYISRWRYDESPEIQLKVGDVLIVKDGSTLGICNYVRYLPRPTTVNGSIAVVRSEDALFPEFLYHFVNGDEFQELIRLKKAGLGVPHLFQADLREFEVSLPPLAEQRKIARILTTLDNLIERTEALIAKYEAIKQGMMHELFTRGIDAHGRLRPPQAEAPDLYKQSELGWIPKEWTSARLGSGITAIQYGTSAPSHSEAFGSCPVLRIPNIEQGQLQLNDLQYQTPSPFEIKCFGVSEGDILVIRTNGNPKIVGTCAIVTGHELPMLFASYLIRIRLNSSLIASSFLASFFATDRARSFLERRATTSAGNYNLNTESLRAMPIPFPSLTEQSRICEVIGGANRQLSLLNTDLGKLRIVKTGLMQDLLTGKVRVKVDELEEVADA